jgi:hypothetical protein
MNKHRKGKKKHMIEIVFINDNAETWEGNYGSNGALIFPPGISRHLVNAVTDDEAWFVFGPPSTNFGWGVDAPWGAAEDNTIRVVYAHKPEDLNVVIYENSRPRP